MTDTALICAALVLLLAIVESMMSAVWSPFYFRHGITIYRRRLERRTIARGVEDTLEATLPKGLSAPFVFRRFSDDEIAFREKAFGFHLFSYTPVMHGLIRFEPDEGSTVVVGKANWSALAFVPLFLFMTHDTGDVFMPAVLVLVMALIYATQAHRYGEVAEVLTKITEI